MTTWREAQFRHALYYRTLLQQAYERYVEGGANVQRALDALTLDWGKAFCCGTRPIGAAEAALAAYEACEDRDAGVVKRRLARWKFRPRTSQRR